MFCKNCGTELQPGMKFCANCGTSCEEQTAAVVPTTEEVVSETSVEKVADTQVASFTIEDIALPDIETSVENSVAPVTTEVPVESPVVEQASTPVFNPVTATNMNQQPVNNGSVYPQAPMQPQNKKKDYIFIIAIVVIGLALIAIPVLLSMGKDSKESSNSNKNSSSNYSSNTNTNNNGYLDTNSNSNNNIYSNTNNNSNNNGNNNVYGSTITYGNYTFTLPANAKATIDSDGMSVENLRTASEMGIFMIQDGTSYEELKEQKELLKLLLQASLSGGSIGDVMVKTYQGIEFLVMPITQEGMQFVCGLSKLSETEIMMTMVVNENGTLDYTLLNEAASIIKTAKRNGASGM